MYPAPRPAHLRLVLAGLLFVAAAAPATVMPAAAGPQAAVPVQLFSTLDRTTVARNVVFVLEVAVYASPATPAEADLVRAAFGAARFTDLPAALQFVRSEPVEERTEAGDDGAPILVVEQRYLFRAVETGPVELPAWQMQVDARRYETPAYRVWVYDIDARFYDIARSILPVVVRSRTPDRRQVYGRIGSAFLVAPDALVTAYHVIMDGRNVHVTLPDGRRVRVRRVWAVDPARDVAVLYIDPEVVAKAGLAPLRLAALDGAGAPRSMQAGQEEIVFTDGWPGGTQRSTTGLHFRDLRFQPDERIWVSTNPVRPGDSGGPLLDAAGDVLGVVSSGTQRGGASEMPAEEVCVATDPRPALEQRLLARRPRSLRAYLADPAFTAQPHVRALRLASLLALRRRRAPEMRTMLEEVDQAVAGQHPPDAGLFFLRASLHQALRTPTRPLDAYRAVVDASQMHLPAVYMVARLSLQEEAYADAERLFRHLHAQAPYRHLGAYGLARALMGQHRYEEARAYLLDVLQFDPAFAPGHYALGLCHLALGDEPRARQVLLRLDPLDAGLAHRLRQALRIPTLRPIYLEALPKATLEQD